jgi:hypothetical protein
MKFGLTDDVWLDVPQAVVLEATRDIDRAVGLTAETTALLVIKASSLLARPTEIPLAEDADEEQRLDALRKIREARTAMAADSHYLEAQQRVHGWLVAGVRTKARRTPGGPYESVDPVEYTATELRGIDAIDKRTGTVMLFDLRIDAVNLTEALTGKPIRAASSAADEMQEQSSQDVQKWEGTGDPVPKLIDWARSRWGEGSQALPNRFELLEVFRGQFGRVLGINEKTMREVRRQLASREARRGGAATHRR